MSARRDDRIGPVPGGPHGADFLSLPARATKPRRSGLTHVLDPGLGLTELQSLLDHAGAFIDIVKFGWGTAYVSPTIVEKIESCRRSGVRACLGGTLLEIAEAQGKTRQFESWIRALGIDCVEISNGALGMSRERKRELVGEFSDGFVVLAEVGTKQPGVTPVAGDWIEEMAADLSAGATWAITEGRESGSVGLFDESGAVRSQLLEAILNQIGSERVIFEAPRRQQQVCLITRAGSDVNLGNIAVDQVTSLETLRLGLRADTVAMSCGPPGATVRTAPGT